MKSPLLNFTKICKVGAMLMHVKRWVDRQMDGLPVWYNFSWREHSYSDL